MLAAILLAVAIEPPAVAPPATSDAPPDAQPGWDEPLPEPPPPTPTTTTTTAPPPTIVEPLPAPPPPAPTPTPEAKAERSEGKGLLIGAGVAAGVGLIANSVRVYVVNVPCQTDRQHYCTGPWTLASVFAWGPNMASLALAGVGGGLHGRDAATLDPEAHRRRSRGMTVAGAVLLGTGALGSILLRVGWFTDWVNPQGRELFDFARTGQAIAYYGGLQASSMAMAAGIGMLSYAGARPRKPKVAITPMGMGVQVRGRF